MLKKLTPLFLLIILSHRASSQVHLMVGLQNGLTADSTTAKDINSLIDFVSTSGGGTLSIFITTDSTSHQMKQKIPNIQEGVCSEPGEICPCKKQIVLIKLSFTKSVIEQLYSVNRSNDLNIGSTISTMNEYARKNMNSTQRIISITEVSGFQLAQSGNHVPTSEFRNYQFVMSIELKNKSSGKFKILPSFSKLEKGLKILSTELKNRN